MTRAPVRARLRAGRFHDEARRRERERIREVELSMTPADPPAPAAWHAAHTSPHDVTVHAKKPSGGGMPMEH